MLLGVLFAMLAGSGFARAPSFVTATAIGAGESYSCALTGTGDVKCWAGLPAGVPGLTGVTAIAAGGRHACALTTSGGVKCWGENNHGQLGDGTNNDSQTPVDVVGLSSGVAAITGGYFHTCAVTDAGGMKCWGEGYFGQLGDGLTSDSYTPVDVTGLTSGVSAIGAGQYHTCAVTDTGGAKCWGNNSSGQVGNGFKFNSYSTPVDVTGLSSGVARITGGVAHTCALLAAGGMKCWGDNSAGQLGDGTTDEHLTPNDVSGLSSGVAAISLGNSHTCALMTSGGVKCWGWNSDGQLGDGTTNDHHLPADVSGLTNGVIAIAAGAIHTCAALSSGGADCWGSNHFGQLGDGSIVDWHSPVEVNGFGDQRTLTVTRLVTNGNGTVSSAPLGILCGSGNACTHAFATGTAVTLTATADPGSYFAGWTGDCNGDATTCVVTMSADSSVGATFYLGSPEPPPPPPPPSPRCKVPNVLHKTLASARTRIVRSHCRLGHVTRKVSTKRLKNRVLRQSPRAGRSLPHGSRVALTVGKGPKK